MPSIEIEKKIGQPKLRWEYNKHGLYIAPKYYWDAEKISVEIPDKEGTYKTGIGEISVRHLRTDYSGIREIEITGDVMLGTPLKDRHKRTVSKRVSLDRYG